MSLFPKRTRRPSAAELAALRAKIADAELRGMSFGDADIPGATPRWVEPSEKGLRQGLKRIDRDAARARAEWRAADAQQVTPAGLPRRGEPLAGATPEAAAPPVDPLEGQPIVFRHPDASSLGALALGVEPQSESMEPPTVPIVIEEAEPTQVIPRPGDTLTQLVPQQWRLTWPPVVPPIR